MSFAFLIVVFYIMYESFARTRKDWFCIYEDYLESLISSVGKWKLNSLDYIYITEHFSLLQLADKGN